ncbi:MAG TPA: hypothetical protein DDW51_11115, partial [Cyanobacteria bacterium UBA11367]|nr:hypothetical protein [Cyanobacteria bacterium UBA11367]
NKLSHTAIVQENLARAYQEIGQIDKAINYWQEVTATYGKLGDIWQVGRSLTEQAQAYTHLGKYRDAIAILCGVST